MSGAHRTAEGKLVRRAALIAITAATLLMLLWAIFPNGVAQAAVCGPGGLGGSSATPCGPGDQVDMCHAEGGDLHLISPSASSTGPSGHSNHGADIWPPYWFQQNQNSPVVFVPGQNWTGSLPCSAGTTTTPITTTPGTTTTQTTTSQTTTTGTTTTGTTTSGTTTTGTTTTASSTTSPPPPPPTTSTTTGTTSIAPTGVDTDTPSVNPTSVSGGTAFTGIEDVVPLGAVVLLLLTVGSGLLWAGRRVRSSEEQG